jgi:hypothetical protein
MRRSSKYVNGYVTPCSDQFPWILICRAIVLEELKHCKKDVCDVLTWMVDREFMDTTLFTTWERLTLANS